MDDKPHRHLVVPALLAFATQSAHAAFTEISSFDGCFTHQVSTVGAPLSATGQCHSGGTGATGAAVANLGTGDLGVLETTIGFGNAEARAQFLRTSFSCPIKWCRSLSPCT
jgi:hypothetical protein